MQALAYIGCTSCLPCAGGGWGPEESRWPPGAPRVYRGEEGDQDGDQDQLQGDQGALLCQELGQGEDTPRVLSTGGHYWGQGGRYWGAGVCLQAWVLGSSVTLLVSTPTATTTNNSSSAVRSVQNSIMYNSTSRLKNKGLFCSVT